MTNLGLLTMASLMIVPLGNCTDRQPEMAARSPKPEIFISETMTDRIKHPAASLWLEKCVKH